MKWCSDPASAIWRELGQQACPVFVRGLIDGARLRAIHMGGVEGHRRIVQFCIVEGMEAQEAIDAVLR